MSVTLPTSQPPMSVFIPESSKAESIWVTPETSQDPSPVPANAVVPLNALVRSETSLTSQPVTSALKLEVSRKALNSVEVPVRSSASGALTVMFEAP